MSSFLINLAGKIFPALMKETGSDFVHANVGDSGRCLKFVEIYDDHTKQCSTQRSREEAVWWTFGVVQVALVCPEDFELDSMEN